MTITFDTKPALDAELDRISRENGWTIGEIYSKGFTLLRIYLDATSRGLEMRLVDPARRENDHTVTVPK